jgi:phospholipid-translocating ATPase
MTITQFFPQLAVGFLFTYIAPLAFVVAVSMGKELYDDINRRIQDKKTNSTRITVLQLSEDRKRVNYDFKKNASELLVGDINKK